MGMFFIDTDQGEVATLHQLIARGIATPTDLPPRPWLRIQGSGDATTMWYAVMRKRERGIFIGSLVLRHSDHHALLLKKGWEEIPPEEIGPLEQGVFSEGGLLGGKTAPFGGGEDT